MNLTEHVAFQNQHWKKGLFDTYPFERNILGKIWNDIETKLIALITGPRRVGKSVVLIQLINKLIMDNKISPTQILFYEFSPEDKASSIWDVYEYFTKEVSDTRQPIFLFFDEVQYLKGYESVIKEIYDNATPKMFLTGSLSLSYKKIMEESLSGRFFHYKLFPLDFYEYLKLANPESFDNYQKIHGSVNKFEHDHLLSGLNSDFRKFLAYGRFPEVVLFSQEQTKAYIQNVLSQSLNQDAFSYFAIEKPQILNALFEYVRINCGGLINISGLSQQLGVSAQTVKAYFDVLEIMGLIYFVHNSTNPLIKLNSAKKAYVNSMYYLDASKLDLTVSFGFAAESYVLEKLLERNETVTFYRNRTKEIDFLLPKKKEAFEVKFRSEYSKPHDLKGYSLQVISLNGNSPVCLF
jgi:predicted AAA+ superfamily ATPase